MKLFHRLRRPVSAAAPESPAERGFAWVATWTMVSAAVLPVTSLLTGPLLARVLGPTGRGQIAAVMAPVFVAMWIASMAVPDAATYVIARLRAPPLRTARTASALMVVYGLIAAAVLYAAAPIILRESPEVVALFRIVVWTLPAMMIASILERTAQGARRYRLSNLSRVVSAVGRLLLLVVLAVTAHLTVSSAVWTQIATVTVLPITVLLVPLVRGAAGAEHRQPTRLMRRLAVFGFLGWGGMFSQLVNYRLDQALLPAFVDSEQIGYYVVAASLTQVPIMIMTVLKNVLLAETSHRNDLLLVARVSRLMIFCTALSAAVGVAAAPALITVLFGREFAPSIALSQIILVGTVPFVGDQMLAAGLLSAGRPGRRSTGQIVAAIITVVGLFVLLPRIGILGAALTSLTAYTVNFLVTLALYSREVRVPARQSLLVSREDIAWARAYIRHRRVT